MNVGVQDPFDALLDEVALTQDVRDEPLLLFSYLTIRDGVLLRAVSQWHGGLFIGLVDASLEEYDGTQRSS